MPDAELIIDVSSAEFAQAVLERSAEVPVLVDFWASWCQPCLMLGPILEKVAQEMNGAFVLAKVDSDKNGDLSARYGVRGIPNVQLFKNGEVVDQFTGVLPEARVRAFLEPHCHSPLRDLMASAEQASAEQRLDDADGIYRQILEDHPDQAAARIALAQLAITRGQLDDALEQVDAVPARDDEYDAAQNLKAAIGLAREAADIGDTESCQQRLEEDPDDLEARFASAGHEVAAGRHREALEHYLAIVQADRKWRDEAPRKAMITIFGIVGVRDPLAEEFRERLRRLLY